jgi:hypothetical protein
MKEDLGVHVYRDYIVAYTRKNGIVKAHIGDEKNNYIIKLEDTNFLRLQKEVATTIKQLRSEK